MRTPLPGPSGPTGAPEPARLPEPARPESPGPVRWRASHISRARSKGPRSPSRASAHASEKKQIINHVDSSFAGANVNQSRHRQNADGGFLVLTRDKRTCEVGAPCLSSNCGQLLRRSIGGHPGSSVTLWTDTPEVILLNCLIACPWEILAIARPRSRAFRSSKTAPADAVLLGRITEKAPFPEGFTSEIRRMRVSWKSARPLAIAS